MTKLFTRLRQFSVTTAPANPPNTGVMAMKVSILRVTTPLVSPAETTFTDCGKLLSENGPVTSDPGVPCGVLYHVGVRVNVADPGDAATDPVTGIEVRLDAWVCSRAL